MAPGAGAGGGGRTGARRASGGGVGVGGVSAADTVLTNGVVYTPDRRRRPAQALAVRGGRIVAVGAGAEIAALVGPATRVIDAGGGAVLPGFIDAHAHACDAVSLLYEAQLFGAPRREYAGIIAEFAAAHPEAAAVRGAGWSAVAFEAAGPRKEELDAVCDSRPLAMVDQDGHALWVNSRALALAGIGPDTPTPAVA